MVTVSPRAAGLCSLVSAVCISSRFAHLVNAVLSVLNALVLFGGFTAILLVESFVVVSKTDAHPSYASIGERACGKWGKTAVNVSCFIEFGVALLGFQIIIWQKKMY